MSEQFHSAPRRRRRAGPTGQCAAGVLGGGRAWGAELVCPPRGGETVAANFWHGMINGQRSEAQMTQERRSDRRALIMFDLR